MLMLRGSFITLALCLSVTATASDFHGFTCTHDCKGHIAGYRWAERKGITDPARCSGNSRSFIEGCMVYAVESASGDSEQFAQCMDENDDVDICTEDFREYDRDEPNSDPRGPY